MRAIPFAPLFTQRLNWGEFHSSMGAQAVASGRCAYIMTCSCHGYLYSHAAESKKRNHSSVEWVSLFMVSCDSADTFCSFVANSVASLSFKLSLFLFLFFNQALFCPVRDTFRFYDTQDILPVIAHFTVIVHSPYINGSATCRSAAPKAALCSAKLIIRCLFVLLQNFRSNNNELACIMFVFAAGNTIIIGKCFKNAAFLLFGK